MKKVYISYSFNDSYAQEIIPFLESNFSLADFEIQNLLLPIESRDTFRKAISEQINKCSIFICFIAPNNPNVMFELGYALAKNKKIIIIGDIEDIPFDARGMAYIQKDSNPYNLLMSLEKHLSSHEETVPVYDLSLTNLEINMHSFIDNPELLENLDGREFENIIQQWFEFRNYNVMQPSIYRDSGYDFKICPFKQADAIVEVKKYKATSKVPLSVIRHLVGAMLLEKTPIGIIVSSAPFTKSAYYFVSEIEPTIYLWSISDLVREI